MSQLQTRGSQSTCARVWRAEGGSRTLLLLLSSPLQLGCFCCCLLLLLLLGAQFRDRRLRAQECWALDHTTTAPATAHWTFIWSKVVSKALNKLSHSSWIVMKMKERMPAGCSARCPRFLDSHLQTYALSWGCTDVYFQVLKAHREPGRWYTARGPAEMPLVKWYTANTNIWIWQVLSDKNLRNNWVE